jgi:FkbM family methyltransferase
MWRHLADPVYLYRPYQILRRLGYMLKGADAREEASLSWGGTLMVLGEEKNGRAILHRGLMELVVTEACFRLAQPGTLAVDGGANIGHMTSALAHAMREGEIWAFEPHPVIFSILSENGSRLKKEVPSVQVETRRVALSGKTGTAEMYVPPRWKENAGIASLEEKSRAGSVKVSTGKLDEAIEGPIHLLKLDVEGHEKDVLKGAMEHLEKKTINHVLFEDHQGPGSDVFRLLERKGYRIFGIEKRLTGPVLTERGPEGTYNYVATRRHRQCLSAFEPNGWKSLQIW